MNLIINDLIQKTVPSNILFDSPLNLKPGMSEEFNKIKLPTNRPKKIIHILYCKTLKIL